MLKPESQEPQAAGQSQQTAGVQGSPQGSSLGNPRGSHGSA